MSTHPITTDPQTIARGAWTKLNSELYDGMTGERATAIIARAIESATAALRAENAEELMRLQKRINDLELEQDLDTLRRDRERLIAATDKAAAALEWVQMYAVANLPENTKTKVAEAIAATDAAMEGQP